MGFYKVEHIRILKEERENIKVNIKLENFLPWSYLFETWPTYFVIQKIKCLLSHFQKLNS